MTFVPLNFKVYIWVIYNDRLKLLISKVIYRFKNCILVIRLVVNTLTDNTILFLILNNTHSMILLFEL